MNPNREIEPEAVPVGAVARIRHYNRQGRWVFTETGGPYRHLGHGWYIPAKYAAWADLVPLVEEWAHTTALIAEYLTPSMIPFPVEEERNRWLVAHTRCGEVHKQLNEAGAWNRKGLGATAKLLPKWAP